MSTAIGSSIANSSWMFAVIESFHLIGLALTGGAVLIVDFKLLGLGLRDESAARLSRDAEPWLIVGLIMMLISGPLLFLSEATKFYSVGFWDSAEAPFIYKMLFLILVIVFTFTVRRKMLLASDAIGFVPSWSDKLLALSSMLLWLGVGGLGRVIAFY